MVAPCRNCTERHTGCHGACERYTRFRVDIAGQKKWLEENGAAFTDADAVIMDGVQRERKITNQLKRK